MHPRFLHPLAFILISLVALSGVPAFLPVVTGAERFAGRKAPTDVAPSVPVHLTLTVSSAPALNEVAQLQASVTSDTDAYNLIIEVSLPKGVSRIAGDLSWTGGVRAGSTSSLSLTVKAVAIGNWTVRAKAGYPVAGGWYGDVAEITLSVQEHAGFVAQVKRPLTMLPAVPVSLAEMPAGPLYQFQGNVTPSPPGVPSRSFGNLNVIANTEEPAPGPKTPETPVTITGRLATAYPMDHPARYYLTDSLGPIELIPAADVGDLYRYEGATIEVTGNLVSQDNQRILYMEKWVALKAVEFPAVSGPQSTLLVLIRFTDIAGSHSVSYFQNLLTGASGSMNAYYVEVSYNMITVTGGPTSQWYALPHASTYYNVDHWGDCSSSGDFDLLANDIVTLVDSSVNFAAYAHYMFVTADDYVWGCRVGGLHIWTNDGVYLENVAFVREGYGLSTFAHEFGHDITMPDLYDYSYADPYGFIDGWDEMGYDHAQHYSSWSKIRQGWIPPSKIVTFTGTTVTATIERIEYTTSGYLALKIKTPSMPALIYYLVETRQKVAFDGNIPASAPDHGVLITKIDESKGSGQGIVRLVDAHPATQSTSDGDAVFEVGGTYTDATYGFSVSIQSWTGTAFTVVVSAASPPDFSVSALPSELTFVLPSSGTTSQTSTITVGSISGWISTVDLSGSWVGVLPNDVSYTILPNPVTPPSGGSVQSTLTLTVGHSALVGTYTLRISGYSNFVSHTTDVTIMINPSPPSATTWPRRTPDPPMGFTVPQNYYKGCSNGFGAVDGGGQIFFGVIGDENSRSSLTDQPNDVWYVNPYSNEWVIAVVWNWQEYHLQSVMLAPAGTPGGYDRATISGCNFEGNSCKRMDIRSSNIWWGYPTSLSASAISSSQINLAWSSNTNGAESSFRIERKTGSAGTYSEVATVGSGSTTYSDTGLSGGTSYYYRVRAYSNTYLAYTEYSNEASATTTGTGNTLVTGIFYNYISEDAIPAAGAQRADQLQPMVWGWVEIRDGNGNFLGGEVTGPDTDDSEGRFQISINNPGSLGFYAVMIPWTSAADVLQSDGSSQYSSYTTTFTTSASTFDIGGWTPPDDNNYKAAWRAYETIVNDHYGRGAWNFLVNKAGLSSSTLSMATVEVLSPDGGTYFHEDPSTYIHIGSLAYTMALDIVQHEYAHYVMYKVYGSFPSTDCPSPHYINGISGIRCGWTEGWADFFPLMVQSEARGSLGENPDAVFEWGSGSQISLEVPTWGTAGWDNGPQVEGRVAGALNDIYDWTNDPVDPNGGYDTFTDYYANIWDTFSNSYDYTFEDFWSAWKSRGHDQSNNGAVACLFHNTIEYTPPFIVVTTTVLITSTVRSTSYLYQTTTATVTSYTSTTTSTSTIPTVTTVVLLPLTVTSIVQSIQYLTSILTATVTSYTGTSTSTSTIPTTVALVPLTMTSTAQSTQYLTSILTTTVTSYTSTSTNTIPTVTTVALVPSTTTATAQSTEYLTSMVTTTVTSYTSTLTSTVPTVTTVGLVPLTVGSTVQSTEYQTSTAISTVTSYTSTTTSTSTSVVYTTVTEFQADAGASNPLAYLGFISLLAVAVGDRVTAGNRWSIPKVRSRMERRCSRS